MFPITTEQLKRYVELVCNLERDVFEQEQIIKTIERRIRELGQPAVPGKPQIYNMNAAGRLLLPVAVIALVSIAAVVSGKARSNSFLLICVSAPIIIAALIWIGVVLTEIAKVNAYNTAELAKYQEAQKQYELTLSQWHRKKELLQAQLPLLRTRLEKSKALRQQVYDCGLIYPKYRNLAAVSSFYDYLATGRTFSLDEERGSPCHGAYSIYEDEVRQGLVITGLGQAIAHLDQIHWNQYMLSKIVNEVNSLVDQLTKSVNGTSLSVSENAFSAYEAEQTRKELEYQNRMNRLTVWQDATF